MIAEMTNEQIARLLELCGKISAVRNELPPLPKGWIPSAVVNREVAKALRASLESKNDLLVELGALLR